MNDCEKLGQIQCDIDLFTLSSRIRANLTHTILNHHTQLNAMMQNFKNNNQGGICFAFDKISAMSRQKFFPEKFLVLQQESSK